MALMFKCYLVLLFVIFCFGVFSFKKLSAPFKTLVIFIAITLLSEGISAVLTVKVHNNMPVYHVVSPIEYLVYTFMYRSFLMGKLKSIITYSVIPVILFAFINSVYIQGVRDFPSNFLMLCQTLYLVYSLLGFRQMLLQPGKSSLYKQSFFWVNIALMFYSVTLFLFYGLLNYSNRHHLNSYPLIVFSMVINFIYYILLATSIFADSKTPHKVNV